MSSSKVEKEDEGLSLISKSMTVDKLKEDLLVENSSGERYWVSHWVGLPPLKN